MGSHCVFWHRRMCAGRHRYCSGATVVGLSRSARSARRQRQHTSEEVPLRVSLSGDDLARGMTAFVEQLKRLLGLPAFDADSVDAAQLLRPHDAIADWQVDLLVRAHLYENLVS